MRNASLESTSEPKKPIEIFFSYSRRDQHLRDQLEKQLSLLKREGLISNWHDRKIGAGEEWVGQIDRHLNSAHIILLLVSADFIASDYCYDIEMKRALERQEAGEARVIPIILRRVDWKSAPFGKLQALPTDGKPITSWANRDDAFFAVAAGIRNVVEELTSNVAANTRDVISFLETMQQTEYRRLQASFQELQQVFPPDREQDEQHVDWGDAPYTEQLYGRGKNLASLRQWIIDDHCRVVVVLGIGGIGKTVLAAKSAEQIKVDFEYIFWRELKNAPPLENILKQVILFLSDQRQTDLPKDEDGRISMLLKYLRQHRCLIVLDNLETILQTGDCAGQYQEGYEGYGKLIQHLGEAQHQSCLLLTSREKPKEIAPIEGRLSPVRCLQLSGLGQRAGRKILKDKGVYGSNKVWADLIHLYAGNPLALKLASEPIRELFKGDIAEFLKEGEIVVGNLHDLLNQQFKRLSELERKVMYWLAIEREVVSADNLREDLAGRISKRAVLEALESLRKRSIIEVSSTARFTLQPVIMEYVIDKFTEGIFEEIITERVNLLGSHALMKAQARDYVRESQMRIILKPLAERLLSMLGVPGIDQKLRKMLSSLREAPPQISEYAAGNIINILVQLQCDLHDYDFSHLRVWQAYLQGVALPGVSFAHADLARSIFTKTFEGITSVAFSPNGELLASGTTSGEIWIWLATGDKLLQTYHEHTDWVRAIAFSPDNTTLVSCADDYTIRLWNVGTNQSSKRLQEHYKVWSVAISPNDTILASASHDGTIKLWDINAGQLLKTLQGHTNWVLSVAIHPDGSKLASSSEDQTIRLWDVNTGQLLKTLQGHTGRISSVAFHPNGSMLASSSTDGTCKIWDVQTSVCLKTLRSERPYERMNITYVRGLSEAQKASLKALGAVEDEESLEC